MRRPVTFAPRFMVESGLFNKIFCIGFNKTGTSSMHQLFINLGLRSYHGYYSHFPVTDNIFLEFQCFSDGDLHDFAALDRRFPGSKFILTTRRLDDWLVSRVRHVEYRRSVGASGPMREEFEAGPEGAIGKWVARRLEYHQQVATHFAGRPDDLLIIDVCGCADPRQLLQSVTRLLGLEVDPGLEFPHENARSEVRPASAAKARNEAEVRAFVARAMLAAGIPGDFSQSVFP